ncbi:MAG: lipoyl(octanoyl) transferase LipB [Myxococcota bacterium]
MTDHQRTLRVERMGRVGYGPMLALQEERHAEVCDGTRDDTLFLLEHEPVVTLGRNSGAGNILVSREQLSARGVELFETGRGGDVTYHGPGQIVGYPIVRLRDSERDIKRFVGLLEEIVIRTAHDFDVDAARVDGLRGIWVGDDKIGAVGVRIARWTTMHGFAFNVNDADLDLDLALFDGFSLIVPCGLHGKGVTSLESQTGCPIELGTVNDRLAHHAASVFARRGIECPASPLPVARSTAEPATHGAVV